MQLQSHITEPEAERIFSDLSKALQSEVAVQARPDHRAHTVGPRGRRDVYAHRSIPPSAIVP